MHKHSATQATVAAIMLSVDTPGKGATANCTRNPVGGGEWIVGADKGDQHDAAV